MRLNRLALLLISVHDVSEAFSIALPFQAGCREFESRLPLHLPPFKPNESAEAPPLLLRPDDLTQPRAADAVGLHRPAEPGDATRPHLDRQAGGTGGPANAEVTHHHLGPFSTPRSGPGRLRRVKVQPLSTAGPHTSLDTTLEITDPRLWRAGAGIIAVTPARRDIRPPRNGFRRCQGNREAAPRCRSPRSVGACSPTQIQ